MVHVRAVYKVLSQKQRQTYNQTNVPGARAGVAREQHECAICVN